MPPRPRLGVMFDRDRKPEELAAFARESEAAGADDLWVVEDLAWAGGISSAALALAATTRLRVGIGIMPAPLRNPALLAMEVATLARVFPGRLVAGIGHGVPGWMEQVGAATPAKLALLEETVTAVRTLLRGEPVTADGRAVRIDGVRLVHPAAVPPPVVTGVVRPRSLELSGRVADGTVIAEGQGPAAVRTALSHIAKGRDRAAEPGGPAGAVAPTAHETIVLTHLCVADDPARLARATAPVAAECSGWLGIPAADVFLAGGTPETVAARIRSLWDAGADTVVLRPIGDEPLAQLTAALGALGR